MTESETFNCFAYVKLKIRKKIIEIFNISMLFLLILLFRFPQNVVNHFARAIEFDWHLLENMRSGGLVTRIEFFVCLVLLTKQVQNATCYHTCLIYTRNSMHLSNPSSSAN